MLKITLTSAETAAVEGAIKDRIADYSHALSIYRRSIKAAVNARETPDGHDLAKAEFFKETLKQLRAVESKLRGAEEGGEEDDD